MNKARVIAFYLPQYHPFKENDEWWGKGFTEWTNVVKAKPLFIGHYQPKLPADLGFYDLRVPDVREEQARLAREAGIEGFCYWHYWFNGHELMERPFWEVVESGKPNFPFCIGWANETWKSKLLMANPWCLSIKVWICLSIRFGYGIALPRKTAWMAFISLAGLELPKTVRRQKRYSCIGALTLSLLQDWVLLQS